jgi:hypothetical protein
LGELTCAVNGIELEFNYDSLNSAASNHDPWNGLATLMTLLETVVDSNKDYLSLEGGKGEWERDLNGFPVEAKRLDKHQRSLE